MGALTDHVDASSGQLLRSLTLVFSDTTTQSIRYEASSFPELLTAQQFNISLSRDTSKTITSIKSHHILIGGLFMGIVVHAQSRPDALNTYSKLIGPWEIWIRL